MAEENLSGITPTERNIILALIGFCLVFMTCEDEYTVEDRCEPTDYSSIQKAINAAEDGDTILVNPGTYIGNIDFKGKEIIVASLFLTTGDPSYISKTILDGNQKGSVVRIWNGEGSGALLSGFTITNGSAEYGGGISCIGSNPRLENLKVSGNTSETCAFDDISWMGLGGGISLRYSSPSLVNVMISGNTAELEGGGIHCENSSPTLINVMISGNTAESGIGGIYCSNSSLRLINVTVSRNTGFSAVINCYESSLSLENTILWNNSPQEIYFSQNGNPNSITITYSDVQGGQQGIVTNDNGTVNWLDGNINADPLFVSYNRGDFHLQEGSPCIDTGNPDLEYNDPDGSRNDMGAYGGPNGDW